ncbi:MAG: Hsp20/alpha crystallin family protein [Hyphomicrobium sp.]|jgi:HSP20 family molecular chaperone IbpA
MSNDFPHRWMWSEACEMLARAERMHQQSFQPVRSVSRLPAWEPPADVLESERDVLVVVALPGVRAELVETAIEGPDLVVSGVRTLPTELASAIIHRLELPQGRFERRLRLPVGRYSDVRRKFADGCLLVLLSKAEA